MSPWGLWDVSGGASEWTESPWWEFPGSSRYRAVEGSSLSHNPELFDRIEIAELDRPTGSHGLRIARAVPGASGVGVFVCALAFMQKRTRRLIDEPPSHYDRHDGCFRIPDASD
jgi:formylglycine-generating enzyme required for sulfatase activity